MFGQRNDVANMTGANRIGIDGGGDLARFPWLGTYRLSTLECRLLADGLSQFQVFTDGQFPRDVARQSLLASLPEHDCPAHRILVEQEPLCCALGTAAPALGHLPPAADVGELPCPTRRDVSENGWMHHLVNEPGL